MLPRYYGSKCSTEIALAGSAWPAIPILSLLFPIANLIDFRNLRLSGLYLSYVFIFGIFWTHPTFLLPSFLSKMLMKRFEKKAIRKRHWINREVQGAIIKRSVFHWYLCTSLILLAVVIVTALRHPSHSALLLVYELWNHFSPAILASAVLLPVFIYDTLRATNRVVGPLHRLQVEMQALASGSEARPLQFRDGDYWQELAEQFNDLAAQVQKERKLALLSQSISENHAESVLN